MMRLIWLVFAWLVILAGLLVFPPISLVLLVLLFIYRKKEPTTIVIRERE